MNSHGRINYTIAGKVFTYAYSDKNKFILGYLANQNRLYLVDKNNHIYSYELPLVVIKYQAFMIEDEIDEAEVILAKIPSQYIDRVAKFLDSLELKREAYNIVLDQEYKFPLLSNEGSTWPSNSPSSTKPSKSSKISISQKAAGSKSVMCACLMGGSTSPFPLMRKFRICLRFSSFTLRLE